MATMRKPFDRSISELKFFIISNFPCVLHGECRNIGISLAGHRDRNKMACFIAGLNPKGIASSSGGLEIGDEILEVN